MAVLETPRANGGLPEENPGLEKRGFAVAIRGREQTAAFLKKTLGWKSAGLPSLFAVIVREHSKLIGYCGFFHQEIDETNEIEIAYRFHPDYWGRGLATEAARSVRDHAFRDLKLSRVISLIHPDNRASRRIAEKNAMKVDKKTVHRGFPTLVFAITREQWLATGAAG